MNQNIAKSRRKYGGEEFKGISPQNPPDKTQMFPFYFLREFISLRGERTPPGPYLRTLEHISSLGLCWRLETGTSRE